MEELEQLQHDDEFGTQEDQHREESTNTVTNTNTIGGNNSNAANNPNESEAGEHKKGWYPGKYLHKGIDKITHKK